MADNTRIEWTQATWNPVTGCTPISEACEHCYARRMARRLAGRYGYPEGDGFAVTQHPERLSEPFKWRESRLIFVVSMGDLFHQDVPDYYIRSVLDTISACSHHTFQILTKRPERLLKLSREWWWWQQPPRHVWLGVTAENQARADERIPILLQVPAAVRFVSCEPLLGPIDLTEVGGVNEDRLAVVGWDSDAYENVEAHGLDWVIAGNETGPGARWADLNWFRQLRDQCQAASVPFFIKRLVPKPGYGTTLDGREWREFPRAIER